MKKKINKNSKQGGARHNSGRKKVEDPKVHIQLYINKSIIEKLGGLVNVKLTINDWLNTFAWTRPQVINDISKSYPFNRGTS